MKKQTLKIIDWVLKLVFGKTVQIIDTKVAVSSLVMKQQGKVIGGQSVYYDCQIYLVSEVIIDIICFGKSEVDCGIVHHERITNGQSKILS